jgi:hypothetical protein
MSPEPLITFNFEPGANYYQAQAFLASFPLAASQLNSEVSDRLGRAIIQRATEILEAKPYHGKNKNSPGLASTLTFHVSGGQMIVSAGGTEATKYAKWVEEGSSRADPSPFLKPAIEEVMSGMKHEVAQSIMNRARSMRGAVNMPVVSRGAQGLSGLMAMSAAAMSVFSLSFASMVM